MRNKSTPVSNIAIICFSGNKGGMEYDALMLARSIVNHFGKGHLICRKNTWINNYAANNKIPHTAINFSGMTSIRAALDLRKLYNNLEVSSVIFFGSSEMPTLYMAHSKQIKSFIVRHGTTKSRSKKDFIHKLTWSKVTSHWCISRHIETNVRQIFPVGKHPTFVNYVSLGDKANQIMPSREIKPDDTTFRIVHVGRLVEGKGQRDAIKIIKILRLNGIPAQLSLYGQGDDEPFLRKLASELAINEYIFFMGHSELPYIHFNKFHACLFPSYGEGLGNAFIEALASGMHCFCYENTVFPELRDLGLEFTMAPNKDIETLATLLAETWHQKRISPRKNVNLCREIFSLSREMGILSRYLS